MFSFERVSYRVFDRVFMFLSACEQIGYVSVRFAVNTDLNRAGLDWESLGAIAHTIVVTVHRDR